MAHRPGMPNMGAINFQRHQQSQMHQHHMRQIQFNRDSTMRSIQTHQQNYFRHQSSMDQMRHQQQMNNHNEQMRRLNADQQRMMQDQNRIRTENLEHQRRVSEQRHRDNMERHRQTMDGIHRANTNHNYPYDGTGGDGFGGGSGGVSVLINGEPMNFSGAGSRHDITLNVPLLSSMFGAQTSPQYYTTTNAHRVPYEIQIPLPRNVKGNIVLEDLSMSYIVTLMFYVGLVFFFFPPVCILLVLIAFTAKTEYVEFDEAKKQVFIGSKRLLTNGVTFREKIPFCNITGFQIVPDSSAFSYMQLCIKMRNGTSSLLISDTNSKQQDRLRQLSEWLTRMSPPAPSAPPTTTAPEPRAATSDSTPDSTYIPPTLDEHQDQSNP